MRMGLGSGEEQYFFQLAINLWQDAVTQIWALEQSSRGGNLTYKNMTLDWLGGLFWETKGFLGFFLLFQFYSSYKRAQANQTGG